MQNPVPSRLALLFGFVCIATAFAQTPAPAQWKDPDRGEPALTHYKTFFSRIIGTEVSYLVYLPPDYETDLQHRYPVVYWLHALSGHQSAGRVFIGPLDNAIRNGRAPAMIVISVNGLRDKFYSDSKDGKWPLESVIIKELIPHVDQTYRTIARREARGIEGFSMGGYGAAHLGFKYPDTFGAIGIMSGALLTPEKLEELRDGEIYRTVWGGDRSYAEANDPFTLVTENAGRIRSAGTAIRIAVGSLDGLRVRLQAFHELLNKLNIENEFELVPGVGHDGVLFYNTLAGRQYDFYVKAFSSIGSR